MKKLYHDEDLTDMALDSQKTRTSTTPKTESAKSKINVIKKISSSSKSSGSSTSKSSAKKSTTATKTKKEKEDKSLTKEKETKSENKEVKPASKAKETKSATKEKAVKPAKDLAKEKAKVAEKKDEPKKVEETPQKETKSKLRSKLKKDSLEEVDLEKLNEESIKTRSFRTRRNRMIIIVLSVLLAVAIAVISLYAGIAILEPNCFTYVYGDGAAVYIINGRELESFRAPKTIRDNRVYSFNAKLKIESSGLYNVKYTIEVYRAGYLVENTAVYKYNVELFYKGADGYYYSHKPIQGKQTIELCKGVDIRTQAGMRVNDANFEMKIHTHLEKVPS